jgi:hypothetical protein
MLVSQQELSVQSFGIRTQSSLMVQHHLNILLLLAVVLALLEQGLKLVQAVAQADTELLL